MALVLAALYALCVLVPSVALAFTAAPAHCLTEVRPAHVHKQAAVARGHHDDAVHAHDHGDDAAPHDHAGHDGKSGGTCCGLFCATAIAHTAPDLLASAAQGTRAVAALTDALIGRAPDRINRPPIG